ncbi:hypothetical protein ABIC03_000576 [Bradyrhizobium sp. RT6a]
MREKIAMLVLHGNAFYTVSDQEFLFGRPMGSTPHGSV